jgi:hypothetical protein
MPIKKMTSKLIYVYVLVDDKEFEKHDRDVIKSALYVGKGTGARMDAHIKEATKALNDPALLRGVSNPSKVKALAARLEKGGQIKAFRISAGYSTDRDAYLAESLAITLINSSRNPENKLLNQVSGHNAVPIADMATHFLFAGSEDIYLTAKPLKYAVLVKATTDGVGTAVFKTTKKLFHFKGQAILNVKVMKAAGPRKDRRGWDPMNPWTSLEAQERARQFWPIASEKVVDWLSNGSASRPDFLFAAVPDAGKTVVRYIWEIDWSRGIEFHPDGKQWGFYLTEDDNQALKKCKESYLGKVLHTVNKGQKTQALKNYSSGVRVIGID